MLVCGLVTFLSCTEESVKPNSWGISYSPISAAYAARGVVEQKPEGPRTRLIVEKAYLSDLDDGEGILTIVFSSNDSISFQITKENKQTTFQFPAPENLNALHQADLNGVPLDLNESHINIEPRTSENRLSLYLQVSATEFGLFDGYVNSVPLVLGAPQ